MTDNKAAGVSASMGMIYLIGAARADATREQAYRLRDELLPYLQDVWVPTGNADRLPELLADIMGTEWFPKGEWADAIVTIFPELKKDLRP